MLSSPSVRQMKTERRTEHTEGDARVRTAVIVRWRRRERQRGIWEQKGREGKAGCAREHGWEEVRRKRGRSN